MSDICETILIKSKSKAGQVEINLSDFDPDIHEPVGGKAPRMQGTPAELGTDSGDQFSDDQLRDAIKAATGKAPHHKAGREKLIEQFNEINADEALRGEIEADLTEMEVEFDPTDSTVDLAALRDLSREAQA